MKPGKTLHLPSAEIGRRSKAARHTRHTRQRSSYLRRYVHKEQYDQLVAIADALDMTTTQALGIVIDAQYQDMARAGEFREKD
nr:hypothetical protein [Candidatus Sigynarchaeota archaeon]